ncbi:MAG: preprotein translocase subunit SecG [Actinobacteria bacterium]|nr:preprotein translocase subunit SecG [Actinomycetota bacterium]
MTIAVVVLHLIFSSLLVLFILMHRGAGGGLSDLFGGGMGGAQGSAVVERNLDRLTVASGTGFLLTNLILVARI